LNFDKGNYYQQKMRAFFPGADIHFCKWKYVHPGAPKLISPNKKTYPGIDKMISFLSP
jgi:hypothetical protein